MTAPNLRTTSGSRHVLCCQEKSYHWHGNAAKVKSAGNSAGCSGITATTRDSRAAGDDTVVGGHAAAQSSLRITRGDGRLAVDHRHDLWRGRGRMRSSWRDFPDAIEQ